MMGLGLRITLGVIALCLLGFVAYTTRLVLRFRKFVLTALARQSPSVDQSQLPPAAVVLALRGPDPNLRMTLQALVDQAYPDFMIHAVVDSSDDPALRDVEHAQQLPRGERIHISLLKEPLATCSLKCSSLVQAVGELDRRYEIVAFIDGDVIPHRTWLQELATPLVGGEVDATGGNRWYLPPKASWGALCRYFWNAAFLIVMWARHVPWAGTMALRRETIDQIGLTDAWRNAMSVDATLHRLLDQHDGRFQLVPTLLMTNREDVTTSSFFTWVTRQLAVARYGSAGTRQVTEFVGGMMLLFHLLIPALAVTAACVGHRAEAITAASMLPLYWLASGMRCMVIEATVRAAIRRRGEDPRWFTWPKSLRWYPALVLTQLRMFSAVIRSLKIEQVEWRGIRYRLHPDGNVDMCGYRPYAADVAQPAEHSVP